MTEHHTEETNQFYHDYRDHVASTHGFMYNRITIFKPPSDWDSFETWHFTDKVIACFYPGAFNFFTFSQLEIPLLEKDGKKYPAHGWLHSNKYYNLYCRFPNM